MSTLSPELLEHCRAVLNHHAKTFSLAGRLLPKPVLDRAAVVYAFCRLVDDTADEADSIDEARRGVAQLQAELKGEVTPRAVVAAYLAVCADTGIPVEAAEELMRGVTGDLGSVHFEEDRQLVRYGYRVAGTVGLMMCGVLGVKDRRAWANAIDLGIAMQITNICRDVQEDAARARVYLPTQRLDQALGSTCDWHQALSAGAPEHRRAASVVVDDLLTLADRYYASADRAMSAIPLGGRMAIIVASRVYRAIGLVLRSRGCDPYKGRAVVPTFHKALWVIRALGWVVFRSWSIDRHHDSTLHRPLRGLPAVAE